MRDERKRKFKRTCLDQAPEMGCHDMGGGGGGGTSTISTIQNADPWSGVQPYLSNLFNAAEEGRQAGPYRGSYLAPESQWSSGARGWQALMATAPHSATNQALAQTQRTIGGDYLSPDSNPYLQGAVQQALDQVKRNVSSQFKGDNYGSSANQEWLAKSLAGAALPIYAQNYSNERQNQMQAIREAPGIQAAGPSQLAAAGSAEDARRAQEVQAQQKQYQAPWDLLSQYRGAISGQPGGSTSSQQQSPYYTNPMSSALGMGIGGLSLYNGMNQAGLLSGLGGGAALGSYGLMDLGLGELGAAALFL